MTNYVRTWEYRKVFRLMSIVILFSLDRMFKTLSFSLGKSFLNSSLFGIRVGGSREVEFFLILVVGAVLFLFVKERYAVPLGLVLAGGVSNVLDRILYGGVFDYLHIESFYFNLADLFVWGGCLLLLFSSRYRTSVQSNT